MSQTFHPSMNTVARTTIYGAVLVIAGISWAAWEIQKSPYISDQQVTRDQPVPFSHKHHVGQLGIDCRYCHTSVTTSAFAGMPPTKTCMTCHSQIWVNAPMLSPVRESWTTGRPIQWQRVHNLPRYAYFDHSIHVNKGVGCSTCHGPINQMQLTYQESSLQMRWCLDCHRAPERNLRPRNQIFNMDYVMPPNQDSLGPELAARYEVRRPRELTNCSTCHR